MPTMSIKDFVKHYSNDSLLSSPLSIKDSSLRSFIKENRSDLEKERIVKIVKKLKQENIEIINPEGLFAKLS